MRIVVEETKENEKMDDYEEWKKNPENLKRAEETTELVKKWIDMILAGSFSRECIVLAASGLQIAIWKMLDLDLQAFWEISHKTATYIEKSNPPDQESLTSVKGEESESSYHQRGK